MFEKNCDIPLGNLGGPQPEPLLLKKINKSPFPYDDFFEILSTCRNASAPGLNGICYKVYKKCSKIGKFLFKIFQACFERFKILIQWQRAPEIYILKVSSHSEEKLSNFRPISSFLNVSGKLFFSVVPGNSSNT